MKMTVVRKRTGIYTIFFPPNYSGDQRQFIQDMIGTFGFLMPFDRPVTAGALARLVERDYSLENPRIDFEVRQLKSLEESTGRKGRRNR